MAWAGPARGGGTDSVRSDISYTLGANVENLTLQGTAATNATGNGLNNALTGNAGNNTINGMAGADTMSGGGGNDTYYVYNAGDLVIEASNGGTSDRVAASVSYALASSAYVETLTTNSATGTAAINLTGNGIAQTIVGNAGNNVINGMGGNDTLTGGAGNDVFLFNTALRATGNVDRITDFSVVSDTIQLENGIFTALPEQARSLHIHSGQTPPVLLAIAMTVSSTRPTRASCSMTATALLLATAFISQR